MLAQTRGFEDTFNDWYKKFQEQEQQMNNEIRNAKVRKQTLIDNARKEANLTIRNYEMELKSKLEADKEKLNVEKNAFEKMDNEFNNEIEGMRNLHKKNKDKVIALLLEKVYDVDLELPSTITNIDERETLEERNKYRRKDSVDD